MNNEILVQKCTNKYGDLWQMGTRKRLAISNPHVNNLTHEKPIVEFIESQKWDLAIDVGAGYGYFTRILAGNSISVIAYEPHSIRYGFLKWNTRDLSNVDINNFSIGLSENYMNPNITGMMGSFHGKRIEKVYENSNYSLNQEFIGHHKNGIVKIDVEGNEISVIKSARKISWSLGSKEVLPLNHGWSNFVWVVEQHRSIVDTDELLNLFEGWNREVMLERKQTTHWRFWHDSGRNPKLDI